MKYFTTLSVAVGLMLPAASVVAQIPAGAPPPAQAAQALNAALSAQPGLGDVIRSRLQQSGMTQDQIRSRLAAAGYDPNLLDSYMGTAAASGSSATPSSSEVAAIAALGLQPIMTTLPVDTGLRVTTAPPATAGEQVFGVDVFRRTTTQFLPLLSGPVPPDYVLGPGDELVLILTGDVELSYRLPVSREGFVLIPQVGQLYVANLTLEQLRDVLYTRLGRVYSGVRRGAGATTQFSVSVANVKAVQVYVIGEVAQPAAYQISSLGTVLTALYAAGGVTTRGNMRQIAVRRAGHDVATFDLYDYLLHGDTRADIRLQSGDVIFVPVHGTRAAVRGAVVRPAIYELKPTETLADVIAAAGGLKADASVRRISIERIVPPAQRAPEGPQRVVVDVPLQQGPAGSGPGAGVRIPPFPLVDGDVVNVYAISSAERSFVEIKGNVYLPGRFAYEPGMKLSRLVRLAGGFQPATYAGRAHIERLNEADSTRSLVDVTLPADSGTAWSDDPVLQDRDVVTIYGRPEMRDSLTVSIAGMVNAPGQYHWREGMTLRDLLLMARGPKLGADLQEAEVARLPVDRSHGELATTIRVPLDSTYLFDRDSAGHVLGPPGVPIPASGTPPVPLQPFDNVLIMQQPGFELQRMVEITGQVRFPGRYALRQREERLLDVLNRAGGLTDAAYPRGIQFFRPQGGLGRIGIDLERVLRDPGFRDNVILFANDSIFVPEYQPTVKVEGAVNSPVTVAYVPGQGSGYYVDRAGGFARRADKSRTYVVQPNGAVQRARTRPEPGARVVVPYVPADEQRTNWVQALSTVAQVVASALTLVLVAQRL